MVSSALKRSKTEGQAAVGTAIAVLAGHQEGHQILELLHREGLPVVAIAGEYSRSKWEHPSIRVIAREALQQQWAQFLDGEKIGYVVDVTRPTDAKVEAPLWTACQERKIPYLLISRPTTHLPAHPLIFPVSSWEDAATRAAGLGDVIFLATGTQQLDMFLNVCRREKKRLVVRVLPEHRVVKKCQDAGLPPKDIVAMQGPFSKKLNQALLQAYKASVLVTKDSGAAGGTDTKVAAALALKLPVVVLRLPRSPFTGQDGPQIVTGVDEAWLEIENWVNK